ncbi:MAG: hypothetical protein M1829_002473 [Trizodia sp. TS-e1964]|nr:MAG: hypothetical protein M1829_002473 [Trizodia sp. TS-e1964]
MAAPVPFSKEAQVLDLFPHKSCDYELPSTFSKLPFIEALSERPSLYNSDSNLAALSSSSIEDEKELLPPPTRKRQLIVLISGFFIVFQTIGLNQSYGIFQAYYVEPNNGMLSSSQAENTAMIALIGTLGAGLTWGGSIFVNPLMARTKRLSHITIAGAILTSLGIGLASSCTQIWQLILTQGLIYGIGSSMLYFPIVSVAPEYFDRHRGTAMGIVLSGTFQPPAIFAQINFRRKSNANRFGP